MVALEHLGHHQIAGGPVPAHFTNITRTPLLRIRASRSESPCRSSRSRQPLPPLSRYSSTTSLACALA